MSPQAGSGGRDRDIVLVEVVVVVAGAAAILSTFYVLICIYDF